MWRACVAPVEAPCGFLHRKARCLRVHAAGDFPTPSQTAAAHYSHVLLRSVLLGWARVGRDRRHKEDAADTAVPDHLAELPPLDFSQQGYACGAWRLYANSAWCLTACASLGGGAHKGMQHAFNGAFQPPPPFPPSAQGMEPHLVG